MHRKVTFTQYYTLDEVCNSSISVTQDHEVNKCCQKSNAERFDRRRVALDLPFVEDAISLIEQFPMSSFQRTTFLVFLECFLLRGFSLAGEEG